MKKPLLLLLIVCLFETVCSYAQPLSGLDPAFANNGIYVGDTGGFARMVVQPDKKIVVAGQKIINGTYISVVQRFNDNGTVDNSFANNGEFRFGGTGFNFVNILPICLQPDGKILLGGGADTGNTSSDFFLARLLPDGSFDSTFGGGGYVMTAYIHPWSPAVGEGVFSVALQPNGKVLAYGNFDFGDDTLQAIRYHPDGRVDSSFGINGRVKIANGLSYPTPNDIAIMPDGRIVIGAKARIDVLGGASAFTAIRLLPNGELDTSFNHTGIAYTNNNLPGLLYSKAMCLQPDGKVLLTGYADSIAVVRFDTSGSADNSFGNGGTAKIAPGDGRAMTIQPDGKILVAGRANAGAPNTPGVVMYRLLPDGSLDLSFGMNGEIYDNTYMHSYGGLALQPDKKILVCGTSRYNVHPSYPVTAIARFMPDAIITGVTDPDMNSPVTIYPNPAADYIHIYSPTLHKRSQISLYAPDGKLLRSQLHPDIDRLSTEGLADGIYYLHIRFADHTTLVRKIIISKT